MVAGILLSAHAGLATAQQDTVPVIRLGEIVVEAAAGATSRATVHTVRRVELAKIAMLDAAVVSDFARLIPAAYIQTNSRGETLIYLRNAGDRQVGVFFEGALLNIPWDNRVDMSLIPASAIGGISVAKGVPPVTRVIRYPLRMALNPFVADIGNLAPQLVSGSVMISVVMSLPTIGPILLQALKSQDIFMAGFILLFVSILTLVGMLISDILLALLDPRIRLASQRRGT